MLRTGDGDTRAASQLLVLQSCNNSCSSGYRVTLDARIRPSSQSRVFKKYLLHASRRVAHLSYKASYHRVKLLVTVILNAARHNHYLRCHTKLAMTTIIPTHEHSHNGSVCCQCAPRNTETRKTLQWRLCFVNFYRNGLLLR